MGDIPTLTPTTFMLPFFAHTYTSVGKLRHCKHLYSRLSSPFSGTFCAISPCLSLKAHFHYRPTPSAYPPSGTWTNGLPFNSTR